MISALMRLVVCLVWSHAMQTLMDPILRMRFSQLVQEETRHMPFLSRFRDLLLSPNCAEPESRFFDLFIHTGKSLDVDLCASDGVKEDVFSDLRFKASECWMDDSVFKATLRLIDTIRDIATSRMAYICKRKPRSREDDVLFYNSWVVFEVISRQFNLTHQIDYP
ncbi:MAG: hypothetical protein PVJ98_11460 [Akkermansiaceae bacterium]|jgi:hypothetical protein